MGDNSETQICGKCKKSQPLERFSPSYRGKQGTWCKGCFAAYARGERTPAVPHEPRICDHCGDTYVPKHLKAKARFCSKQCGEDHRNASLERREWYLRRKYGIGIVDYDRMLEEQGGGCAICGRKPESQTRYNRFLHVDHCHDTGRVRGLLCDQHNLLIGRWDHDPVLLRRAAEYLERS